MRKAGAVVACMLALASCGVSPDDDMVPPAPALWQIETQDGAIEGWLFGTIHALPPKTEWRSREFDLVMQDADLLVVEASDIIDKNLARDQLAALARDNPVPPLRDRLSSRDWSRLRDLADSADLKLADLDTFETWAVALAIGAAVSPGDASQGVDRALLDEFPQRDTQQLEGVERQLQMFDRLPEMEQRDLLVAVIGDAERALQAPERMAALWRAGDLEEIAIEGERGILEDPELRIALLVERNLDWTTQLDQILADELRPLIAVGTAHLIGPDGLPAMLEARGYRVFRIQ